MANEEHTAQTSQGFKVTPLRFLLYLAISASVAIGMILIWFLWDVWSAIGYGFVGFALLALLIRNDQKHRYGLVGVHNGE